MKSSNRESQITVWGLPDTSMAIVMAVVVFGWTTLSFFDWLFGYGAGPEERGWFRSIILLVILLPLFFRWFRPTRAPIDHQDAYRLHGGTIITGLSFLGLLILVSMFPFAFTQEIGPGNFLTFVVGRLLGLLLIVGTGLLVENLFLFLNYSSRLPQSAIDGLRYGLIFSLISYILVSGETGEIISLIIGGLTAFGAFFLSLRSGWIVHLWRYQKYRMLGLSFLGILAGIGLAALLSFTKIEPLLKSVSPMFHALGGMLATLVIVTQIGLFIRVLLTLPTAGALDRRNVEVSSLSNFGRLMVDSFDMNDLMKASTSIACDVTSGKSAWIELHDNDLREIITGGKTPLEFDEIDRLLNLNVSKNGHVLGDVAKESKQVRVFNFSLDNSDLNSGQGIELPIVKRLTSGSLAVIPLHDGTGKRGILYVVKEQKNGFDQDDTAILNAVATQIALAMDHARLIRKSIERERLRNEMLIAREAQQRLLPSRMPQSPLYEIYAESEPASMVGGDYFDAVLFRDGSKGALIADVSGKGAGAALYMGMVKGVIRALSGRCTDPAELLIKANHALYRNIDPRFFVTMTCLRINDQERRVQLARAGHCPTLIIRKEGKTEYHTPQGIGLALTSTKQFERSLTQEEIVCSPGDMVMLFSDGLAEARRHDGEELGFERFRAIVEKEGANAQKKRIEEIRDAIFTGISTFTGDMPPVDDSTLVMLRWKEHE